MKALGTDLRQIRPQVLTKGYPDTKLPGGHTLHMENQGFQMVHTDNGSGCRCYGKAMVQIHRAILKHSEQTPGKTSYSKFKSCIVNKLASQIPVASSPIATRWQQECTRNQVEQTFAAGGPTKFSTLEDTSDFTESFGKITAIPVSSKRFTETTVGEPIIFPDTSYVNEGSETKKQQRLHQMMIAKENRHGLSKKEGLRICAKPECLWKGDAPTSACWSAETLGQWRGREKRKRRPLVPQVAFPLGKHMLPPGLQRSLLEVTLPTSNTLLWNKHREMVGLPRDAYEAVCSKKFTALRSEDNPTINSCKGGTKTKHDADRISVGTEKPLPLEPEMRFHISGLRNDYYLNLLDWSHGNLLALALGSVVCIWNGETNQNVKSIDLCFSCKSYVASIAWMRENPWLAFATSDGEVQLWDIETQKKLRTMFGHLSVVGALHWNGHILSSGSRLGYIHHHDIRATQHHIGTVRQSKQSVCSLQWSPDHKLLASGSSDGLLNIWPNDPGVTGQCRPLTSISHSSAVKAMKWCPWQSDVIATGGGIKDRMLHIWNISSVKRLEMADTRAQVCSLLWLPNTKELITGEGCPWNKITVWRYPMLSNSAELCDHKGRVLHMSLSPEGNKIFSAGADDTAYVWMYRRMKPNTTYFQEENCFN